MRKVIEIRIEIETRTALTTHRAEIREVIFTDFASLMDGEGLKQATAAAIKLHKSAAGKDRDTRDDMWTVDLIVKNEGQIYGPFDVQESYRTIKQHDDQYRTAKLLDQKYNFENKIGEDRKQATARMMQTIDQMVSRANQEYINLIQKKTA